MHHLILRMSFRYQAMLAERQFNKVDPDNRLVASELERHRQVGGGLGCLSGTSRL